MPGNHDWYDGLHGFMSHLCGLDVPRAPLRGRSRPARADRAPAVAHDGPARRRRPRGDARGAVAPAQQSRHPPQPGPYWAIDAGPVRIVGIDTGIVGAIDAEQAAWLRRVSLGSDRPKILADRQAAHRQREAAPGARPPSGSPTSSATPGRYVMAIGGDTHNYQRYPVRLADGRVLHYVVSGGGGAYTHATHQIPKVDVEGVSGGRVQVLSAAQRLARALLAALRRAARRRARLAGAHAGRGGDAAEPGARASSPRASRGWRSALRARLAGWALQPAPSRRGFHRFASEFFDWDDPPFFKHFLRVDADAAGLRVRCFGVSGCARASTDPPVEDEFTVPLPAGG